MSLNCCGVDAEFVRNSVTGEVQFLTISVTRFTSRTSQMDNTTFVPTEGHPHMSAEEVEAAVMYIYALYKHMYVVVSWSGTDSDWRHMYTCVVTDEARRVCAFLAQKHVDLAYLLLCHKGYMTGLEHVASQTLKKKKPMASSDVHAMWAVDRGTVLELAKHDATVTCELYLHANSFGTLQWQKRNGTLVRWNVPMHMSGRGNMYIKTVRQGMTLPHPLRVWRRPITRESCVDWLPSRV